MIEMDLLLRLFDFFNVTAKNLANYLPQSGSDLIELTKKLFIWGRALDIWIGNNLGVNVNAFLLAIGKISITVLNFVLDLLKQLVGRM